MLDNKDPIAVAKFHFAGHDFVFHSAERPDQVADQMRNGSYEAPLPLLLMATICRTRGLFLDVGANTGLYTILASRVMSDQRVIAFEPFPQVFDVCRMNVEANHVADRVRVLQIALSDRSGMADLYIPDAGHGLIETSCSLEQSFKPAATSMPVELARYDDLDIGDPVSVVKVDIEGHEAAFIRGADRMIRRDRPIIFAEMLLGAEQTFAELSRYFADLEYTPYRLRADLFIKAKTIRFDDHAWNYAMMPNEKMNVLAECSRIHGFELLEPCGDR